MPLFDSPQNNQRFADSLCGLLDKLSALVDIGLKLANEEVTRRGNGSKPGDGINSPAGGRFA